MYRSLLYKKVFIILLMLMFTGEAGTAQICLDSCYSKAARNYPLIQQYDLIQQTSSLSLSNASKYYLPQVALNGKASWQSEVTEMPDQFLEMLTAMGIDGISFPNQDQYQIALELSQVIWDGGRIAANKKNIEAQAEVQNAQVEVNLYSVKERINQLYFGILLLNEQLKQNQYFLDELQRNYDRIQSYMDNGLANASDLAKIRVEQIAKQQNSVEMENSLKTYRLMLSLFIGEPVTEETVLIKPEYVRCLSQEIQRPELKLYQQEINRLDTQRNSISAMNRPQIGLFAQGAYGNPGLNLFKSEWSPYFIGGVSLRWDFAKLYTFKNDNRMIEASIANQKVQEEVFLFNLGLQTAKTNTELEKYDALLAQDDEIIALRQSIRESSLVKYENGTMSFNDYLQDLLSENIAAQLRVLHEIQRLHTCYQLKVEQGQ